MFAWWYATTAVGFLLLAIRSILVDGSLVRIVVTLVIGAAFAIAAVFAFRRDLN